jgi:hypothetical protein
MPRRVRLLLGSSLLLAISLVSTPQVRAESGYYTSDDGPWCYFSNAGTTSRIICFGYSRTSGGLVQYHCDYRTHSASSVEWACADNYGNRWGSAR